MSTKIRNGLRLVEGVDIFDATAKLREVMNPIRDVLDARLLVGGTVGLIDRAALKGEALDKRPLWLAYEKYEADQKKRKPTEHGHDPNRFGMSFGRDEATGRILALSYFEREEYGEALRATGLFEDYSYWNNTDHPKHLSKQEWDARGDAWDRVVGRDVPARSMITFDLRADDTGDVFMLAITHDRPAVIAQALEEQTRERRAKAIADLRCLNALVRGADDPLRGIMTAYRKAQEICGPLADAIEPLLPEIDVETLFANSLTPTPIDVAVIDEAVEATVAAVREREEAEAEA